jgi:DNA-binding transcriptional ArsR family regulator
VAVKLVGRLAAQPKTVQELVSTLEATQQSRSQHLGILQRADIVSRNKEGMRIATNWSPHTSFHCSNTPRQASRTTLTNSRSSSSRAGRRQSVPLPTLRSRALRGCVSVKAESDDEEDD